MIAGRSNPRANPVIATAPRQSDPHRVSARRPGGDLHGMLRDLVDQERRRECETLRMQGRLLAVDVKIRSLPRRQHDLALGKRPFGEQLQQARAHYASSLALGFLWFKKPTTKSASFCSCSPLRGSCSLALTYASSLMLGFLWFKKPTTKGASFCCCLPMRASCSMALTYASLASASASHSTGLWFKKPTTKSASFCSCSPLRGSCSMALTYASSLALGQPQRLLWFKKPTTKSASFCSCSPLRGSGSLALTYASSLGVSAIEGLLWFKKPTTKSAPFCSCSLCGLTACART